MSFQEVLNDGLWTRQFFVGLAAAVGIGLFFFASGLNRKKQVPYANTNLIKAFFAIAGNYLPTFLAELSEEALKTGRKSFRLPLPIWGGWYVCNDVQTIRQILNDPLTDKAAKLYKAVKTFIGSEESIFSSSNNSHWRMVRKSTAHAFARSEVQRMQEIAIKNIKHWLENDAVQLYSSRPFDPAVEMWKLTLRTICEAAFEYNLTEKEIEEFSHNLEATSREYTRQLPNPFRKYLGFFLEEVRTAAQASLNLQKFGLHILNTYRNNPNKSDRRTVIKLLDSNENFPSDQQRVAEILIFLVAGHDTTGFYLSNTLVLLARYPSVLTKLRSEASGLAPEQWATSCPYFKYVVKESFRYLPVTPLGVTRIIGKDYDAGNGEIIPKGATVTLLQNVPFHDAAVFKDADKFDPDRWYDATREMNDAVIPFCVGSRNCAGQSLANAEIDMVLPLLLSRYNIELIKDGELDYFVTWKYVGVQLQLRPLVSPNCEAE